MSFNAAQYLKTIPNKPGVYQMFDAADKVIYVGKAKDLKKRVNSYFRQKLDSAKTQLMMRKVTDIQITVTHTENEALILENNLIKELAPRYNIFMRDDKSYPFIVLTQHKKFPRLNIYRGHKRKGQRYFGPFPNVGAVKETLHTMQKLFQIRSCSDSYFNNRQRPCLQYQIKRCSAPCVDLIEQQAYQQDLNKAILFLEGKNKLLINTLTEQMKKTAVRLDYEKAAQLRDKIEKLTYIQEQQFVMREGGDFDVLAVIQNLQHTCIALLQIREGKLLGSKHYFPKLSLEESNATILHAFINQFYLSADFVSPQILTNSKPEDSDWLNSALSEYSNRKVEVMTPVRGEKKRWVELAKSNAEQKLNSYLQENLSQKKRLAELASVLKLEKIPGRIECFDISHSQGEATVASCVVFDEQGAVKRDYRRFNIEGIVAGDDYAALRQAIFRRYAKQQKKEHSFPDLLIVDGGRGQLKQAMQVFTELGIENIALLSIAKGTARNPDFDMLWQPEAEQALLLKPNSIALHLVQQIRDEAHRFAIMGHKQRRRKKRMHSVLENIEGVGAKRRRDLLNTFGGLQGLRRASVEEIASISGIGDVLAKKIYGILKHQF